MSRITINHIAIVVENIDQSLAFWRDALGLPVQTVQDVPQEEVQVAFLEAGDAHIELVQPISDTSGIARYLAKKGTGIHHICLEVDDLQASLDALMRSDVELINETPRERDGRKYAFIHPRSTGGVLVELYER